MLRQDREPLRDDGHYWTREQNVRIQAPWGLIPVASRKCPRHSCEEQRSVVGRCSQTERAVRPRSTGVLVSWRSIVRQAGTRNPAVLKRGYTRYQGARGLLHHMLRHLV